MRRRAAIERSRAELRTLVKLVGYVAVGSVGAYLVVVYPVTPGLVARAVIAGVVALVGGGGAALYAPLSYPNTGLLKDLALL